MKAHNPQSIRPPFANYAHAIEIPPGYRLLALSGQLGARPDDTVPEGAEAQADLCFGNIREILRSAGMTMANLVRINGYVTAREHMAGYMRARDRAVVGLDVPPASTLMIVSGFTREAFVVEVEALAAAPRDS